MEGILLFVQYFLRELKKHTVVCHKRHSGGRRAGGGLADVTLSKRSRVNPKAELVPVRAPSHVLTLYCSSRKALV